MEKLLIDKSLYSKLTLLKTAYSFTNRAYLHLSQDDEHWIVDWKSKDEDILSEEFENELIQQQLRTEVLNKTADIRKILLARALASTVLERPENAEERLPAFEDPATNDILESWFEHDNTVCFKYLFI